jgi:hypothetical protein
MTKPLDAVKFNRHVFGHQGFAHIMERARPQHALALLQQLGDRTEFMAARLSEFQAAAMRLHHSFLAKFTSWFLFPQSDTRYPFRTRFITALFQQDLPFMSTK